MNVWFEKLPLFKPTEEMKPHESTVAEGVIDIEKRRMKDDITLLDLSDFVGGFKRERRDGLTYLSLKVNSPTSTDALFASR